MQRNIYKVIAFAAVLCCALWNYKETLAVAGSVYNVLQPFIIGLFIAFIVNVLMVKLEALYRFLLPGEKFSRGRRPVCLAASLALILLLVTFTVVLVIPQLHDSIRLLIKSLPAAWERLNIFLQQKSSELHIYADAIQSLRQYADETYKTLAEYLQNNKSSLLSRTVSATASVVDLLTSFAIGLVASIYLLLEKERLLRNIKRTVYALCSRRRADYLAEAAQTANRIFTGFVGGQVTEAIILGLLYLVGMLLCGFPYAFTISILVAVLGLIPLIGTFISFLIGCFLILVAAPEKIWLFCLFFIVLQRIEGDLLYPKIVGKAVGLSELWVLAAVTIGGSVGGILGMFLGVPICSVVYALISKEVEYRLEQKNLQDL